MNLLQQNGFPHCIDTITTFVGCQAQYQTKACYWTSTLLRHLRHDRRIAPLHPVAQGH